MEQIFDLIKNYGSQLSAIGAAVAFIFAIYKFQVERAASHFWKEFEAYHKLVKELVEPPSENGAMFIDRQTAAIYELRFYKRYYSHSSRMLKGLRDKWAAVPNQYPRLIEELNLTIEYIEKKL
ncbi:hypothetical protein [Sulfuricurvum sp. RIFCSPLOWO2_12_FULL_43_24]|uniref:hypothetical protein n=1 Tax=Sulfuricurvum sp. RIFCSPLOWO2_12_FULL_43_24 TaxID=1802247 RepID=UPI0008C51A3B|nr:hypothetical protein [Sulfuricurvum sp. RIFCSPLOWO2_12_FULL_43_24]OHD89698.1 MAG: hypothetical protein A3G19_04425 [Sulfuricurvum sp. RIFCSPLOWO2_12_FULL_43_24]